VTGRASWSLIVAIAAVLAVLLLGKAGGSSGASTNAMQRTRVIASALTLEPGRTRTLYSVRGVGYGTVGRFIATCARSGRAETTYRLSANAPDALVAVDGRGSARGAKLTPPGSLRGGSRASGIERWIVLTGGKPEEIEVDASLLAISANTGLGFCELSLRGRVAIRRH